MHEPASRPSSTSSSERSLRRDVLATALVVAAALVAADAGFRRVLPELSLNSRLLAAAPARAERLRAAAARPEPSLLILGNSIGRDGIDPVLLGALLRDLGRPAHIEHQAADSSDMRDWYYQLKNQFVARGAIPDVLVLPVGNLDPLIRQTEPSEDLVRSFLRFADLGEFFALSGIAEREVRAGLGLEKLCSIYGFRGRLRSRVLTELLPGFPDLMGWVRARGQPGAGRGRRVTSLWAERVAALAAAHRIRVVTIAMPTSDLEGRLPPADRELAERLGWGVLEPAATGFGPRDRPDGLHLTQQARARLTRRLAPALARWLAESGDVSPR